MAKKKEEGRRLRRLSLASLVPSSFPLFFLCHAKRRMFFTSRRTARHWRIV
jgi:hypothetical protein